MAKKITPEEYERLTPFAKALLNWAWRQNDPPLIFVTEIAEAVRVNRSTASAWFSPTRPTIPTGHAWHQVQKVTGWPIEQMLELTGMSEPPPDTPSFYDFLLGDLRRQKQFVDDQERIGGWLRDANERYAKMAKPLTRRKRGQRAAAVVATTAAAAHPVTPPATPGTREPAKSVATPRREREKVGSGK